MQKKYLWMMAAILIICGANVFTACTSDNADNPTSVPAFPLPGDTWDAAKHTFTWQGTPAATVEMLASGDVDLENVQIRFSILR